MIQYMSRSVLKTFFIISITSAFTYFFIGLNEYKKKILLTDKYTSKNSSNIVILTGGSNRIKDGLKIIDKFPKNN